MVYSLVLTCRACNVEPYAYLHYVLTEMPQRASDADIRDLLPFNFAKRVQLATTHPPVKHPDLGSNPRSPRARA
jgi:transposase